MTESEMPAPKGRRATLRAEALESIKAAALEEVRRVGAADVSLRAIARGAGMSPAGMYRYFDGRDALLTALIADSFTRLAARMERAVAAAPPDGPARPRAAARLRAAMAAYRRWGVEHPHEYGLVFGNPIPGYAAPADGDTTAAIREVSRALFTPLLELWSDGGLVIPAAFDDTDWSSPIAGLAAEIGALLGTQLPPALAAYLLSLWGRLHGIVSLEVFGQLDWVYPDGAEQLFDAEVATLLSHLRGAR